MSSFDPRSPGFGTTTYSSISDSDSDTPRASTDSSASPGLLRRVAFSPPPPSPSDRSYDGHGYDDSFAEHAEVEAALTELDLDAEINATQDAVSQWSSSRPSYTSFTTSTPYTGTGSHTGTSYSADTATATGTYFTRDPRILSTISERTENPSRPTSFAQNRLSAHRLSTISNPHARSATEATGNANRLSTHSQGHTRGATDIPTTSRRTGDLIAFFEDRSGTPGKERERTTSPFLPTTQSTPHLGSTTGYTSTGYGYTTGFTSTGYGYTTGTGTGAYTTTGYTTSRPSSPAKSRSSDSRSTVSTSSGGGGTDLSLSSLLSPPVRGFGTPTGTFSGSGTVTATANLTGRTQLSPSDFASTFSSAFGVARGRHDDTTPTRQTQTALRRSTAPQNETNTSPRSPLTSVRNIVAAWKERTPGIGKAKSESSEGGSAMSPAPVPKMEGLFSLRRRASRQGPRGQLPVTPDRNVGMGNVHGGNNRNRENEGISGNGNNVPRRRVSSASSLIPPPFDMTDLGSRENRQPIRIGTLWYLNVHSPTPYRWVKCSALLYPHVLILSWSAPGGGRGVVSLDLINCTEVRSTPGFTHPGARGDVGGVSAAAQVTDDGVSLLEVLCPFQLLYGDGVERLAAESARERVRWVSAIWEALDRSLSLPSRSQSGSPTGSIGTILSITSTTSTSAGSRSTVFVPPLHTIPSLSDLGSDSGGLSLSASRVPSVGGHGLTRTTDDTSYLYPSDPRIIAPSRSSSLRRTSSLTDLDEEFASAVSRARSAKPGLGFGLSLVNDAFSSESGGILGVGEGSPVTVSSGPRLGSDVRVTPPPTGKIRNRALSVSEEEFFSAGSRTSSAPGSRFDSDFFSADSSRTTSSGNGSGGRTTTGLVTDETAFEFTSGGSNTQIVPSTLSYRRTESNSYLGDSHDGSGSYTPYTSSDGRSRTPFSSSDGRSRTPYTYSSSGYTSSTPYTYTSGSYAPTPSSPSLSRTPEVRRRRYGAYSTSEEPSDREHSTTTRSTLSGWTRSRTPTTATEGFLAVEEKDSSGSEGYTTAHASPSPSTASFKSLPTIPSESDYQTLDTCKTCVSTEFVTAERCVSDIETEYVTAEKCKTETETDFWTAEVCKSDKEETQYETASVCITIPSEEGLSTPRSGLVMELPLAEEPIYLHEEEEEEVEMEEEVEVEVDLPPTPPPKSPSVVPSIVSEEPAVEISITPEAVTAQEEITEDESLLESAPPTPEALETQAPISFHTDSSVSYSLTESELGPTQPDLDESISSLTESSEPLVTATPRTEQTPALSISDHDEAITPSVHPSQWPSETDISFDSSALQPTPSAQSVALQEGIDGSFETSFMRPSVSPLSSVARLTPITDTVSSLTSSPMQMLHPSEVVSSPSSGPTPLTMSTSASSSLSRTASTVSGVSSIAIEVEDEDAVSVRAVSDISTVPSLLSTRSEQSVRYMPTPSPLPWNVPLPQSPAPPSVSMSVSMTTPHDDIPSIHSVLETEHTHTHIEQTITHDIDRLLHHIHEIDQFRGQETQEISENVRAIRDELYDLSEYVRTRLVVGRSPPVPTRDMSVGGSSVLSTPRVTVPSGPRPQRLGITLVEMSPPPVHPSSPSSLSSGMSFLSSHHSDDDLSLLETELEVETVERSYSISREPSWPSSSSSSSSSITPSEISSSEPSPGPSLSATSSSSPTPPPSSPTPSTASAATVRQRDSITIETLRDMLTSLREQTTALWEGQVSTNHMLDELRETRAGPLDTTEFNERLQTVEVLLRQLIDRQVETERPVPIQPPSESISELGTDPDAEDFQLRWQEWTRLLRDRVPLAQPQPRRARGNLDDELLALLQAPSSQVPIGVQPPPALIPFAYQPAARPPRSRSTSPIARPATFPSRTEPVVFSPEIQHRPIDRSSRRRHAPFRRTPVPATMEEPEMPPVSRPHPQPPVVPPPGVFSDPARTRPLTSIPPPEPINLHGRPPSAPANLEPSDDTRDPQSWYRPPRAGGLGVPPPPSIPGQQGGRQYVPMPPGPTVVQMPLFDTLMNILREHRLAQLATVDQQRELMRYMRGLNEWLERDVQDRQAELRGVTARVDELRNDLARLGLGMQPGVQPGLHPTMQMPQPQVAMPHAVIPGGPVVPPPILGPGPPLGFVPQPPLEPPVIPAYDGSPQPDQYSPFIPDEPRWPRQDMPRPYPYPAGAQGPVVPGPGGYDEYQQRPAQYEDRPHDEDEGIIPTSPHSRSDDGSVRHIMVQPPPIILQHSDARHSYDGGSDASSGTQHTYVQPRVHHPAEGVVYVAPSHQEGIPAVVQSGEYTSGHGSPQPQHININIPPQQAPFPPPVGMADQHVPMQAPQYGGAVQPPPGIVMPGLGQPPGMMMPGSGTGPPLIIHPPPQGPEVVVRRSSSRSRSSSGSPSSRMDPHVMVVPGSPRHHSPGPIVLQSPSRIEYVERSPTHHPIPIDVISQPPAIVVPGTQGHVSRSRSRSPHGRYHGRSPSYDDPRYRRRYHRHPDSPDYYPRRGYGRRRSRSYSPDRRHRRDYYDDYSPDRHYGRRRPHGDSYSRTPSPRGHRDDDRPRRRLHRRRHPDSRSPTRTEEGDPGHERSHGRRPRDEEDAPHRRTPTYDDDDPSRPGPSRRTPTYDDDDHSRPGPSRRTPSYRTPSHRTPSHRTPTEFEEADAPSHHHTPSRQHTPSRHHTPSQGIPGSQPFEDAPQSPSPPTIIRIDQPGRTHPDSHSQPVIITPPGRHPRSPTSQLEHELRYADDGYVPTLPSQGARSHHRTPVMEDDAGRSPRRTPDDDRPSRRRTPPAREDDDGDDDDERHRRAPSAREDDARRPHYRTPEDDDRRTHHRLPDDDGPSRRRSPSAREDDDGDDDGERHRRTPSARTDDARRPHHRTREDDDRRTRHRLSDDDGPSRRRSPSAREDDDGDDDDERHRRTPSAREDDARRLHYRTREDDDRRTRHRLPDDDARWSRRAPSTVADEADPRGDRGASRVPSRAGSRAAGVSPVVPEDDDGRPPSQIVHVPPPHSPTHVHFDPATTEFDDALHQRHERLDEAERELTQVVHDAREAEDRREDEFRHNEDAREQVFVQNEDRREAEARERSDALFAQLEERAHSVPPLPVRPPGSVDPDNVSIIESIHAASHEAASRHASEILDTVRLEREQFERERESIATEREREHAEFAAERARMEEERERRVQELEEELARVRGELDGERQLRQTENEEQAAASERDEAMRAQLGDITQLVSEQRDECTRKRELMDQRWDEKQGRRAEKDAQFRELKDMVSRLMQDREADRIQEEERRLQDEGKPDIQAVIDQLTHQNIEMREALHILSENWRVEGERRHQDTLDAVRATAREQVPFNVQVYLDEFSKALATEVRMLLGEVGKLREERRNIQHEVGYLIMTRAKYNPGGEFDPEWKPPPILGPGGPDAPPPPEAPPPPPEEHGPVRPAWRTIPRSTRRIRKSRPDQPPPEPAPAPMRQPVHSWVAWRPDPAMAPTPPSIEPNLIVPDQGSPGLFGPRSPRGSYHR